MALREDGELCVLWAVMQGAAEPGLEKAQDGVPGRKGPLSAAVPSMRCIAHLPGGAPGATGTCEAAQSRESASLW